MRPLVRWTIGPVLPAGFKTLRLSVENMRKLYGKDFDYLVCHNQLSAKQVDVLKKLDCNLYEQQGYEFPLSPTFAPKPDHDEGTRACWKLYPPRFRPDGAEFIIDNDLVICERIDELDDAASGVLTRPVLCEGMRRSYGFFDPIVHGKVPMNNGLIGLPPGFDFSSRLKALLPKQWAWSSYFDDQGLTAAALCGMRPRIIPRSSIELIEPDFDVPPRKGYHFVMVNYIPNHQGWKKFSHSLIKG